MKILKILLLICAFTIPAVAQRFAATKDESQTVKPVLSNIIHVTDFDTAYLKIELKGAQYDASKNNQPFYLISRSSPLHQIAKPNLIIKKINLVTGNAAPIIKKQFGANLKDYFQIISIPSIATNQNLNYHKLYPFRINAQNEVEELIDYEIKWEISQTTERTSSSANFKNSSVLANGNWYKIGITKTGIYKIDRNFLVSLGINVGTLNPKNIRIYGNGGRAVPELNGAFRYDDLEENAIQVIGEEDNFFDVSDYVLFYATDVNAWERAPVNSGLKFRRVKNYYSDTSFYYINVDLGNGKRITNSPNLSVSPNVSSSSYDYYNFHDVDQINFIKSGRQWFGEYFDITTSYNFPFNDGSFVTGDSLLAHVVIGGRGKTNTLFAINGNGVSATMTTSAVDINSAYDPHADVRTATLTGLNNNSSVININITKLTPGNLGWLDFIVVNARRQLHVAKQTQFRDTRVVYPGAICGYNLLNQSQQLLHLWNVTDPIHPIIQGNNASGNSVTFICNNDSLLDFAAAPNNDLYTPTIVGKVVNQNLHALPAADYLIVTHPLFISHAQRLANLHQQKEGLSYAIATTEQIYNEFGCGKPEASAIRDFIRMFYSRHISQGKQPKYVVLLGDGSYNNKSRSLITNSNLIPTYQSPGSVSLLASTTTDDFYGLMDINEGAFAESVGVIDIGIGRLTCRTVSEMDGVINKIENYYRKDPQFDANSQNSENCATNSGSTMGDWRNWLMFMADDGDQAWHMSQANSLANQVKNGYPVFNLDKVYLDAYQRFSTPGGHRYPDAESDMNRRVRKGVLLFNFTGHGGEVGLTSERVLNLDMINSWDNYNRLHLFVTATCEFTRYDDPGRTSAGEFCLLNGKGGSIALLTTCRLAFSSTNFSLNTILLNQVFAKMPNGKYPTLGDVIRKTKATLSQGIHYANFHLIGDPALTLAYPEQKVITTVINSNTVTPTGSDTLGALNKVTIKGFVADTMGNKMTGFNGIIYPTVFDKEQDITSLLNDASSYESIPGNPFKFKLQKNILYRGKTRVKNGEFSFTFMVPKDISFAYGPGKISYYATDGTIDASGVHTNVVVGGGSTSAFPDAEGPGVNMYLNEKNFVNGGTTNEKPVFYAKLIDSSGINTVGTGIGHDISIVLNGNASKPIILNDYYEADLDSYQSGMIRYPFENLPEGNHNLTFKVWDIQNNSSVSGIDFVVAKSAELALNHVLNYPNPFTTHTKFFFEHNQACNPLKVTVQVFTISGKAVKTIQQTITCEGFRPEGINWDGRDDYGDRLARGVYIYKVSILDLNNKKAEKTEKLVILN
jgi:hypothetical protein